MSKQQKTKYKDIEVKTMASYNGHAITNKGVVTITFSYNYGELPNSLQLSQMLNNNILIGAKHQSFGEKPIKLGQFMIKQITIKDDGCSSVKLSSIVDTCEISNVNKCATVEHDDFITILYRTRIELEEG